MNLHDISLIVWHLGVHKNKNKYFHEKKGILYE